MINGLRNNTLQDEQFARQNMGKAPIPMDAAMAQQLRGGASPQNPAGQQAPPSLSQAQLQQLSLLPPDQKAEAVRRLTQDYKGARGDANDQMKRAQADLNKEDTQGIQAGKGYVAGNVMGHIADGLRKYKANKSYDEAMDAKKKLTLEYGEGNASRMDAGIEEYLRRNK